MFLSFVLISIGIFLFLKLIFTKRKPETQNTRNRYISEHEKKISDDKEYQEYLEWCKMYGELPKEKEGFEDFRRNEIKFSDEICKRNGIESIRRKK